MRKINKEVDPQYLNCPIRNVIDKFGDKWSLLVLYHLNEHGTLRFNELYPEVPPRVEYSLTARGKSLMPHVSALIGWALENFDIAQN